MFLTHLALSTYFLSHLIGSTTKSELSKILKKFGQNLTNQELDAVMAEVDTDGDGVISLSEFKEAMEA